MFILGWYCISLSDEHYYWSTLRRCCFRTNAQVSNSFVRNFYFGIYQWNNYLIREYEMLFITMHFWIDLCKHLYWSIPFLVMVPPHQQSRTASILILKVYSTPCCLISSNLSKNTLEYVLWNRVYLRLISAICYNKTVFFVTKLDSS